MPNMTTQRRPGGRTERTRTAVLDAAFIVTAEAGYAGLTVDAVAERSGIHKTTIYRRWGSVDAILFDAVVSRAEATIPLAYSGDARSDLISMGRSVVTNLQDPVARAVAGAVLSQMDDGDLSRLSKMFWKERIGGASEIVRAGQRAGDIDPLLEPSTVVEEIIGPLWFRVMVLDASVDGAYIERLVDSATR
jgi:AcrR family transcriptional regulator